MKYCLLGLLLLGSMASAQPQPPSGASCVEDADPNTLQLCWTNATENTNGTPYTNAKGTEVSYGLSLPVDCSVAPTCATVPPDVSEYVIDRRTLGPGTWFFSVRHQTSDDRFSRYIDPITLTVAAPPPVLVDCVVNDPAWTLGALTPAVCPVSGQQSRVDARTLSVVTQPVNGGLACPPLPETRTVPVTCTYVPPPVPSGVTVTRGVWDLYRGSSISVRDLASEQACIDRAATLAARTYSCRTRTTVVVR